MDWIEALYDRNRAWRNILRRTDLDLRSLNVNGLATLIEKSQAIGDLLRGVARRTWADVVCIQETHLMDTLEHRRAHKMVWPFEAYRAHAPGPAKSETAIMIQADPRLEVLYFEQDD